MENHPDNNRMCSEALRLKAPQSSLVEKGNKLVSGGGVGGRRSTCCSRVFLTAFAWLGNGVNGVRKCRSSIRISATLTVTLSGGS